MSKQGADSKAGNGESESIADKYFVCTECLVEGNVQSFVDLFYLTHAVAAQDEADGDQTNSITSYETLQFLKTRLTEAEVVEIQRNCSKNVIEGCNNYSHRCPIDKHNLQTCSLLILILRNTSKLSTTTKR